MDKIELNTIHTHGIAFLYTGLNQLIEDTGIPQEILEELTPYVRLRRVNQILARENNVLAYQHELEGKVRNHLARSQRDQILRTQIRVLQTELGEDDPDDEIETYRRKVEELELDEDTEAQRWLP